MTITVDMLDAVKVQWLSPLEDDTFVERGMKAWLTGVEWNAEHLAYELFFDFSDFDVENDKYFRSDYYDDDGNSATAKEVGAYNPKYSVLFGFTSNDRDDTLFEIEIEQYLKEVE